MNGEPSFSNPFTPKDVGTLGWVFEIFLGSQANHSRQYSFHFGEFKIVGREDGEGDSWRSRFSPKWVGAISWALNGN